MTSRRLLPPPAVRGFSLIELMIALLIGVFLLMGLVQIFSASKAAYRISEGLARVQENGRFAMDYILRDTRMAGHFGCKSDQTLSFEETKDPSRDVFESTLNAAGNAALDFDLSIEGYEASGTEPGKELELEETPVAGSGSYTPALPAYLSAEMDNRVPGSDILVLRYLAPEGIPVTAVTGDADKPVFTINVDDAAWNNFRSGVSDPGLFGVTSCDSTTLFQASGVTAKSQVTMGSASLNTSEVFSNAYSAGATLYRAESEAFYVGLNAQNRPTLYRLRFVAGPGGDAGAFQREELVEGVENMQLLYGQDQVIDASELPTGSMSRQETAEGIASSIPASARDAWRRVGSVQIGLLLVSPERATTDNPGEANELMALGVTYSPPQDRRYRTVYQTTATLRNRLFGN